MSLLSSRHGHSMRRLLQARMETLMQGIQQLLPLLTVAVASTADVSAAVADLSRRAVALQGSSSEAAAHLGHLQAAVSAIASTSATVPEIENRMMDLRDSMTHLHDASIQTVLQAYDELQGTLGRGFAEVRGSLDGLQQEVASMRREVLVSTGEVSANVKEMHADVKEIMGYLAACCGMRATLTSGNSLRPAADRMLTVRPSCTCCTSGEETGIFMHELHACARACSAAHVSHEVDITCMFREQSTQEIEAARQWKFARQY